MVCLQMAGHVCGWQACFWTTSLLPWCLLEKESYSTNGRLEHEIARHYFAHMLPVKWFTTEIRPSNERHSSDESVCRPGGMPVKFPDHRLTKLQTLVTAPFSQRHYFVSLRLTRLALWILGPGSTLWTPFQESDNMNFGFQSIRRIALAY